MGNATVVVKDANFEQIVTHSDKPVLLDFWAQWCGPCLQIAPILEELATEYQDKLVIGKIDIDENQNTPMQFAVRSIPTLLFFKDGKVTAKHIGSVAKSDLKKKIEDLLSS